MRYNLVKRSRNRKVGKDVPIVQDPRGTCWKGCPFKKVCYGEQWPLGLQWDKVEECGAPIKTICDSIREMPEATRWRYADVGDLPGTDGAISEAGLRELVTANHGKHGWCYTHKPVLGNSKLAERNRYLISWANSCGFAVNLSAEGWKQADRLADLEIGPVFTVLPHTLIVGSWRWSETPAGRRILRCPAEWNGAQCSTCGGKKGPLCARQDRDYVIGVTSHGCNRNRIAGIVAEIEMFG
jgi:hypothetical protein